MVPFQGMGRRVERPASLAHLLNKGSRGTHEMCHNSRGSFLSMPFNHRSLQKPGSVFAGVSRGFLEKRDPWKEWGRYP